MTVIAPNIPPAARVLRRTGFTIAADGSYAACLAEAEPAAEPAAAPAGAPAEEADDAPGGVAVGPAGAAAEGAGSAAAPDAGPVPEAGADPGSAAPAGAAGATGAVGAVGAAAAGTAGAPGGTAAGAAGPEDGRWFVERWTLGGPEPYAVPLPGGQPEEPGTQVVPLSDGRVLVNRRVADRHDLVLLYPTGPGTGELPVCSLAGAQVRLLPPAPVAGTAFAVVCDEGVTTIWQVFGHGAPDGSPVRVMSVEGRCSGGVWLDRTGRLLALDRAWEGRTKAIAADLHTAEISPLLQLTDDSDDRLLLAEPDSGLLMLRSNATGEARIGWGVLGSRHPVRFPDALQVPGALLTPLVAQPGQILSAEATVVALRAEVPGGAESLALWRPGERQVHWRATPRGWLGPTAFWLPGRELRLPYAIPDWPCGLITYDTPDPEEDPVGPGGSGPTGEGAGTPAASPGADPVGGTGARAVPGGGAGPVAGGGAGTTAAPDGEGAGDARPAGQDPAAGGSAAAPGTAGDGKGAGTDGGAAEGGDDGGAAPRGPRLVRNPAAAAASAAAPAPIRRRLSVLPLQQAPLAAAKAG